MPIPGDMRPIARDGEIILYSTDNRQEGIAYDSLRGEIGDRQPLQVLFKWGNFVELTDRERVAMASRSSYRDPAWGTNDE